MRATQKTTQSKSMNWSSWSDFLGVSSVCLGLVTALFAVPGWYCSWRAGKIKDGEVAAANVLASTANEEAARANESAAALRKEAEVARLAHEQLKEKLAWRTISPDDSKVLVGLLKKKPGKALVNFTLNDPESMTFAMHLADTFRAAGWGVSLTGHEYSNGIFSGGFVQKNESQPEETDCILSAFAAVNLPFGVGEQPLRSSKQQRSNRDFDLDPKVVRIWIGYKHGFDRIEE